MDAVFKAIQGHLDAEEDDKALQAAEEAVTKAGTDQSNLAEALRLKVSALIVKGDRKTAAQVAKDSLSKFSSHKIGKAKMLLASAEANSDKRGKAKKADAMQAVVEAEALFAAEGDKRMSGHAQTLIANLQIAKGDCEEAVKAAGKAKASYKAAGDKRGEGIAEHCFAVVAAKTSDVECINHASEAISCFQAAGLPKMEAFERICLAKWTLEVESKPKKALKLAQQAEVASRKVGSKQAHAAVGVAVESYMASAKLDSSPAGLTILASKAIRAAQEAAAYFESVGDKAGEAFAKESQASAQIFLGGKDSSAAIAGAESAAQAFGEAGMPEKEAKMRSTAASLQYAAKKFGEASKNAKQTQQSSQDRAVLVPALDILFKVAMQQEDYTAAKDYAKKMVSILNKAKNRGGEALAKLQMAQAYFMGQDAAAAVSVAKEAQNQFHDIGYVMGQAASTRLIAKMHFDAMELEFALRAATKQRSLLRDCGNWKAEAEASLLVADIRMEMMLNLDEWAGEEAFTTLFFEMMDAAKEARYIGKKIKDELVVAHALSVMAQAYTMVSEAAEALTMCEEAGPILKANGETLALANLFLTEAEAWFIGGEAGNATKSANKAKKIFEEKQDDATLTRIAALLLRFNPPKKAAPKAEEDVQALMPAPEQQVAKAAAPAGGGPAAFQKKQLAKVDLNNFDRSLLRSVMYNVVQETVGFEIEELEDDLPLMQAGIASRTAVTMRALMEDEVPGVAFPATLVFDFPSINSIMDFIEDKL